MSDSFLETNVPLLILIDAAKRGDEQKVEEYAGMFQEHANKLVEVSDTQSCATESCDIYVVMVQSHVI